MNYNFSDRINNTPKSFIREILKASSEKDVISFAGGLPNPISFPCDEIRKASSKVLEKYGAEVLQYSTTEGYLPLREYIAKRYKRTKGLDISPSEILITNGSQQALDLIGKIFLQKDDEVLLEKPSYLGAIQAFSMFEPKFLSVELEYDGVSIDDLKNALLNNNPKLFYTVPNFQNPSGVSYSDEKRKEVAKIIKQSDTILIEDDPYGELRIDGKNKESFRKYDSEQTILLGSFSKIVSPGMRMGWIVANEKIMDKLITAKQACDLHSNYFSQRVICQYLEDNDLDAHIYKIKNLYKIQRNMMISCIEKYFPSDVSIVKPEGGMFLWVTLPKHVDALELFEKCSVRKVVFVPGAPFYTDRCETNTFRLNYTNSDEVTIEKGIRIIGEEISDFH